jgi:SAM-dependent methyltransferase
MNAVRRAYAAVRRLVGTLFFERPAGIDTASVVHLEELGLAGDGRQDYHPTPWLTLKRVLREKDVRSDDVFIDFGCGKGRVVFQAAMYPFRKVIGVELSPTLAQVARVNIEGARARLACKDVEIVTADVMDYDVPDEVTFVYFFDPFHGAIFSAVVEKLLASLRRRPRELTIIYFDPAEEKTLLAAGAKLVRSTRGLRPTRSWSRENAIHVYKLCLRERDVKNL